MYLSIANRSDALDMRDISSEEVTIDSTSQASDDPLRFGIERGGG